MKSLLSISYFIGLVWTIAVLLSEVQGGYQNLLPEKCGETVSDRISYGSVTRVFDYPWMAVVRYIVEGKIVDRCGGSLINERYVLTAAHCIRSRSLHSVILGEHTKGQEPDCNNYYNASGALVEQDCADPVEVVGIESFEYHPDYNRPSYSNDIGLLRLNRSVIMKDHIQPICLPVTPELRSMTFPMYIVTGWGRTESKSSSDVLLEAVLPQVNNEDCQVIYDRLWLNFQLDSKQMCAGGDNMVDTCKGDSGGPLGFFANYGGTRFIQFGIVSAGIRSCGQISVPGVYCRVADYMDWILDNMQPSHEPS